MTRNSLSNVRADRQPVRGVERRINTETRRHGDQRRKKGIFLFPSLFLRGPLCLCVSVFKCRLPYLAAFLLLTSCGLFTPEAQGRRGHHHQSGRRDRRFPGVHGVHRGRPARRALRPARHHQARRPAPATADDVAFFLELFYRKNGYSFVSTSYTIVDGKHLVLKVDEGPLVLLGDIRFTGNDHYRDVTNFQQYIIGQTRERFPASRKDYALRRYRRAKGHRPRAAFLPLRGVSRSAGRHAHGRVRQQPHPREPHDPHRRGRAIPLRRREHRRRSGLPARAGARPHRRPDSAALHPAAGRCHAAQAGGLLQEARIFHRRRSPSCSDPTLVGRNGGSVPATVHGAARGRSIISTACASSAPTGSSPSTCATASASSPARSTIPRRSTNFIKK